MDRTQLFDTLSNLPPATFERLLIAVNMPRMNRAGATATIGEQVSALLVWAESPIGPGVEAIAQHLTELNHFEFDAYLRSLVATYEKWWEYYTLTDAVGKIGQPAPEKPSVFDFGLMVQTVAKETDGPGSDSQSEEQEETERLPVLEGIRKYADDHVLLVGRPGSGKSTALIRLLLEEATQALQQSEGQLPVLVELRYWNTSIEGLIQGFLQRHGLTLDDATLSTLLSQGRFLLLIDGLNELPSESTRNQLSAFRRNHPKMPMIFTTRDLGLGGDLGIEKKLEMQPLTKAQMKVFIRAYVPDQAEAMLRQLNNRLREFGQTPLLLWMLCEVFQQSPNRQMPTNLAEVFRAFTTMYEDSSVRKHEVALLKGDVRPLSDRRLWKDALKTLAALMMQGETSVDFRVAIHRTEAERELSKIFANEKFPVRDILDDLLKYHLLQNRTTDQLEFRHQLIQEYYAAEYLLCLLPDLLKDEDKFKRDYLNLLKWTETIALMLALVPDENQAFRVVKLAMDNVDLILGSKLAGKVKASIQSITVGWIRDSDIPAHLKIRCWAMSHSEAAIPGLLTALEDPNNQVRLRTAMALGQIGSEAAIAALLTALEDPNNEVRGNAVAALRQIGSEAAIAALLTALEHPNNEVRGNAALALGQIGGEAVIAALLTALEHPNNEVRWSAAAALGQIGSEAAIPSLLTALEHPNNEVRWRAAMALGKIGGEVAAIPRLLIALENADADVRRTAASALGQIGGEVAIPGLLTALEDSDDQVRWRAASALGEIGGEATILGLLTALEDSNDQVRWSAAQALGKIGGEAAIAALLTALEDLGLDVPGTAAHGLKQIGRATTIAALWQLYFRQPRVQLEEAISAIQNRCKFYNYDIWQTLLAAQQNDSTPSQSDKTIANTITIQTVEKLTIMSDKAPVFNQQHATIGVNYAAEGSQQDFIQHIHAPEQNFEILLTSYKQFIDELQQQNPHITNETAIIQTIDIEARRIDTRWRNFLNLKRLWNGGKKAAIKVGEHFVESNPWGKGAIAFLEGVSEDVK